MARDVLDRVCGGLAGLRKRTPKTKADEIGQTDEEQKTEPIKLCESTFAEEGRKIGTESKVAIKKSFEFRERLWSEPPGDHEMGNNYSEYECLDEVQKEFKEIGGKDFQWKTNWLDMTMELWLLLDYQHWVHNLAEKGVLIQRAHFISV